MASGRLWIFLALTNLVFWERGVDASALKFCATSKRLSRTNDALRRTCNELKQKSSSINCVIEEDRLSCLRMLASKSADFVVLEPEDLTIINNNVIDSNNLVITHELKIFADEEPQHDVEMIAIVKNQNDNGWVTRDKRLCYIGFEMGYQPNYHYHYTSYFERWLINKECDSKKSVLENRIADLSRHFQSACIAGPWSLDAAYDGILKSRYKNLCALCGSPSGCFEGDRFYGMQGAIQCLLENVGDIAWLSRTAAVRYFKELASYGFSMLCPDGMFMPLLPNKTCTWIAEPRASIVTRSELAEQLTRLLSDMADTGKKFYPVIHASYKFSHLAPVSPAISAEDYMRRFQGYLSSRVGSPCRPDRSVRWCVASNLEASKCGWMQAAASSVGIEPAISCIQQKDRRSALRAVGDDRCDIYVAKPDEEIHARGMNLTPVAHIISNKDLEASRFAAIVRKDARYKSFADLKGANACFAGYKSVGWNAFFSILRNSSSSYDCSDQRAISQFFNQSCVMGLDRTNSSLPANLYSLCDRTEIDKSLGAEENTFKCLMNAGDVAFVNVSAAKKYYSAFSIFRMNYKILCQDESHTGGQCFIAETTLGSILAHKNITQTRQEEIYLMLLSLDRFFGRTFDRETAMFSMYGPYDGQSNVIFPDKTQHLQKHASDVRNGRTYEEILQSLQDQVECGAGSANSAIGNSLLVMLAFAIPNALRMLSG